MMQWSDLGRPKPRTKPKVYSLFRWSDGEVIKLPVPAGLPSSAFVDVVLSRRTRRIFDPVSIEQLSQLLWLTSKCHEQADSSLGFPLELRPIPSAGAIHPIHILLFNMSDELLWRYEPVSHGLIAINGTESVLKDIKKAADQVVSLQDSTVLVFVAEPGKTFAKYEDASSLIWRDAGVMLGHLGLVSELLSLNYCPLGITGEPWVGRLDRQRNLSGVGLALIGSSR